MIKSVCVQRLPPHSWSDDILIFYLYIYVTIIPLTRKQIISVTFISWFLQAFFPPAFIFWQSEMERGFLCLRKCEALECLTLVPHSPAPPSLWWTQCHRSKPRLIVLGALQHRGYSNYLTATLGDWVPPLKDGSHISIRCIMWMTG